MLRYGYMSQNGHSTYRRTDSSSLDTGAILVTLAVEVERVFPFDLYSLSILLDHSYVLLGSVFSSQLFFVYRVDSVGIDLNVLPVSIDIVYHIDGYGRMFRQICPPRLFLHSYDYFVRLFTKT